MSIRFRRPHDPRPPFAAVLIGAVLFTAPTAGRADDGEAISPALVQRLEEPLKAEVAALTARRNEDGASYMRGHYSKRFQRVDDSTYQALFHQDTASEDTLLTERYRLTLKRDAARDVWSIAGRTLEDSLSLLSRGVPGDEDFGRFESFVISREGMTVRGGAGSLYKDFRKGKLTGIVVVAPDLAYSYVPPLEQEQSLWAILRKERIADIEFTPEHFGIACDTLSCEALLQSFKGLQKVERAAIDPELERIYAEDLREARQRRREQGFSGFRRDEEPGRQSFLLSVKKKTFDHWTWLNYDSAAPEEVSFGVTGLGQVYAYNSEATRKLGIAPIDLERRDDLDERYFDLQGLMGTVELGLEDAELVRGDLSYELTTKMPLKELPFRIARLTPPGTERSESRNPVLVISRLEDGEGRELTWVRTGSVSGLVILPEAVEAGTPLSLHMVFENSASVVKFTPSFSYVDRGGWLPFVSFNDPIEIFDLTVKVPKRYKTLCVGTLASTVVEGDASVTRWTSEFPVKFPTVIFGDYLEDEPGFKATKLDKAEIPVTIHVDRNAMTAWGIRPKQLRPLADDAANALNLYREVFGSDYPYAKLDLVNDPLGSLYGQSPASIVYLGSAAFRSAAAIEEDAPSNREGYKSVTGYAQFMKSLVSHEVAHQWWGALVANANDRNYWFVESLAEYSSALFVEQRYGRDAYLRHVDGWRREILHADLQVSVQDAPVLWANGFLGYRAAVYAQGPYMFHVMRSTWGDEKFFAFCKLLAQELQGKEIVTRDIQQVAETAFGGNMDWFFDQWIRGVGMPEYTFTQASRKTEDGGYLIEGNIAQRVLVGTKKHPLPGKYFTTVVPITIVGKSGKVYRVPIKVAGAQTPFKFKVPEAPAKVQFNAEGEALAHDVIVRAGA